MSSGVELTSGAFYAHPVLPGSWTVVQVVGEADGFPLVTVADRTFERLPSPTDCDGLHPLTAPDARGFPQPIVYRHVTRVPTARARSLTIGDPILRDATTYTRVGDWNALCAELYRARFHRGVRSDEERARLAEPIDPNAPSNRLNFGACTVTAPANVVQLALADESPGAPWSFDALRYAPHLRKLAITSPVARIADHLSSLPALSTFAWTQPRGSSARAADFSGVRAQVLRLEFDNVEAVRLPNGAHTVVFPRAVPTNLRFVGKAPERIIITAAKSAPLGFGGVGILEVELCLDGVILPDLVSWNAQELKFGSVQESIQLAPAVGDAVPFPSLCGFSVAQTTKCAWLLPDPKREEVFPALRVVSSAHRPPRAVRRYFRDITLWTDEQPD